MFKMWLGKFIRRIWGKKKDNSQDVPGVSGDGKKGLEAKSISAEHSELAARNRRLFIRESVDKFTRRLWDAGEKLRGMERLLRKQPVGSGKDEAVQQRKDQLDKRNIGLSRFSRTDEYRLLTEFLRQIEEDSYLNLRHPDQAKDTKLTQGGATGQIRYSNTWISTDYFVGFQNGRLETVEDLRSMFMSALMAVEKQKAKEQDALQNRETEE